MRSNANHLFIAWAISLILVLGGILLMEAVYTPHDTASASQEGKTDNTAASTTSQTGAKSHESATEETAASPDIATYDATPTATDHAAADHTDQPDALVSLQPSAHTIPVVALPALLEETPLGLLPKVAADGRKSYNEYAAAKPSDQTSKRIALIITDLGLRTRSTTRALEELPANVSLAFSPYGNDLEKWGQKAREKKHEVFLGIPMEPSDYPQNDPGPLTLLTSQTSRESVALLRSTLGKLTGYVGVINHMGSRFTTSSDSLRPILKELHSRGLMFIDSRSSPYSVAASMARAEGIPVAINNGYLDENLSHASIMEELEKLETRALAQGAALGVGRAYPITFEAIKEWSSTLNDRGIILVPVTAIANMQAMPR